MRVLDITRHIVSHVTRALGRVFERGFTLLDLLVPKRQSLVVFGSSGGTCLCGNSKALYDYIRGTRCGLTAYYFLRRPTQHQVDSHCLISGQLRTLWLLVRAKTVVSTHGIADFGPYRFSRRTLFIQTWHGVGPKADGLTRVSALSEPEVERNIKAHKRWDVFVSPSKIAAYNMCACVMMDPRKVFLCGQPRNDVLLKRPGTRRRLSSLLCREYRKAVLYCPTWRRRGETRPFPFEDSEEAILDVFLEKHDAVLLLRPHVNDRQNGDIACSERIISFSSAVCDDINEILPDIDVLVTDYSSIYVDFLLLDRPVVFMPYDLDEYKKTNGMLFDDYDFWTPGRKVSTCRDFVAALDDALLHPGRFHEERRVISSLLNYYQADDSCGRIVNMIRERVRMNA